jgi:L-threonylcarbamoyladenylate synthase
MESTVLDLTVDPPDIVRPGSVTAEQLLPYLGRLRSPALKSDPERWAGARRRESRLVLVDVAPGPRAAQRIWNLAMTGLESGRRPGLLMTTEGAAEMAGERGLDADSRASARESAPESPSAASAAPAPGAAARSPALVLVTRGGIPVAVLGPRGEPGAIAASLYAGLRALEGLGCNLILAEPVPRTGLGVAVMDRLEKAAAEVVSR